MIILDALWRFKKIFWVKWWRVMRSWRFKKNGCGFGFHSFMPIVCLPRVTHMSRSYEPYELFMWAKDVLPFLIGNGDEILLEGKKKDTFKTSIRYQKGFVPVYSDVDLFPRALLKLDQQPKWFFFPQRIDQTWMFLFLSHGWTWMWIWASLFSSSSCSACSCWSASCAAPKSCSIPTAPSQSPSIRRSRTHERFNSGALQGGVRETQH